MYSITEFFKENKSLIDSFEHFVKKHIPSSLLTKCRITKVVDTLVPNDEPTYPDCPLLRLIGIPEEMRERKAASLR